MELEVYNTRKAQTADGPRHQLQFPGVDAAARILSCRSLSMFSHARALCVPCVWISLVGSRRVTESLSGRGQSLHIPNWYVMGPPRPSSSRKACADSKSVDRVTSGHLVVSYTRWCTVPLRSTSLEFTRRCELSRTLNTVSSTQSTRRVSRAHKRAGTVRRNKRII